MDYSKSFDEKIKIDNNLSNRYIDLDPNGYFIIKLDFFVEFLNLEYMVIFCIKIPLLFVIPCLNIEHDQI